MSLAGGLAVQQGPLATGVADNMGWATGDIIRFSQSSPPPSHEHDSNSTHANRRLSDEGTIDPLQERRDAARDIYSALINTLGLMGTVLASVVGITVFGIVCLKVYNDCYFYGEQKRSMQRDPKSNTFTFRNLSLIHI